MIGYENAVVSVCLVEFELFTNARLRASAYGTGVKMCFVFKHKSSKIAFNALFGFVLITVLVLLAVLILV